MLEELIDTEDYMFLQENFNHEDMIIVLGKGHSGTRAISQVLVDSGVFMGAQLNPSYDNVKDREAIYETVWHYHDNDLKMTLKKLRRYLRFHVGEQKPMGWKMPQTTMLYPLLIELFPNAKFIFWTRRVYETIRYVHFPDTRETKFNLPKMTQEQYWTYQNRLVVDNPKPDNFIHIRLEDFVLNHEEIVQKLETFLGFDLNIRIPLKKDRVYFVDEYPIEDETERIMKTLGYSNE